VARKSGKVRQESEAEQSRREDVGEEYGMPRGKCAAKGGSYRERGGQIMQKWGDNGGGYRGGGNIVNKGGNQLGPRRDPNAMDVDRGRGRDRKCYQCGKFSHMAQNCWEKNKARIVDTPQESAKENRGQ